jgi:phenylacetate-CoA ligase
MSSETLSEEEDRYPALTDHGRRTLAFLREHPHAPILRNVSGHHLRPDEVLRVKAFEREVAVAGAAWQPGKIPEWMDGFIGHCFTQVPFYRKYGPVPHRFLDLPLITRADLSRDIAQFVPDNVAIDRLINFRTTGTTGHPLLLASHPVVAASYLAFHKRAMRRFGIELRHGRNQVGVVLVGFQRKCFTYVSVTPTMDESGLVKLNLHPDDWRNPADRARYLDALAPEVVTGDPISLGELARLPIEFKPRAVLSTSMALTPGFQCRLQERFGCPVLDLYSLNEAGPVAVYDQAAGGHVLLQHRLYVEILNQAGEPVGEGERGEVTLTGGFNFCLPLLRYRTGDQAALRFNGRDWVLDGLVGRPAVMFRTMRGEFINNIEVTHVLREVALTQYALHQKSDGALKFSAIGNELELRTAERSLAQLFGSGQIIEVIVMPAFEGKIVQYTSEIQFERKD